MNILKVHECVKVENQRLVLLSKMIKVDEAKKRGPKTKAKVEGDEVLYRKEIIELTARINNMHMELKENG